MTKSFRLFVSLVISDVRAKGVSRLRLRHVVWCYAAAEKGIELQILLWRLLHRPPFVFYIYSGM